MPDLLTHVAFASFFADKKYRYVIFLLAGAVLPDVTRIFFIIFTDNYSAYWFFTAMHSPFISALLVVLLVQFFEANIRRQAFWWMLIGVGTHLILDSFQIHFGSYAYPWLFPFSFQGAEFGFFWPEDSLYIAPFLAIAAIIWYYIRSHKLKKAKEYSNEK